MTSTQGTCIRNQRWRLTVLIAAIASTPALAQHAPGAFSQGPRVVMLSGPKRMPKGYDLRLENPVAWELGPLSPEEAAPRARYGARQIGIRRLVSGDSLFSAVSTTLPDGGRVLRFALRSEGAVALRVHFIDFSAGSGEVWLYDTRHGSVAGPYTGRGLFGTGEFWSSSVASDEVVVEFDMPAETSPDRLPFRIDSISHHWSAIAPPTGRFPFVDTSSQGALDAAATCELDVNCYPGYGNYAAGVVLYDFVADTGGGYSCSGAMVNNKSQTFEPYMLTAHHCIGTSSEAQSIQAYFNFQTSSCHATPPDLGSFGRVLGAVYLTGASIPHGDYALVRFKDSVGISGYFFGWSNTAPAVGDPVVGIHHPEGSWARISFGSRTADQTFSISGSIAPADLYYQVDYTQGVVEPGSSGSPLLNSNGEIVGTLTGVPIPGPSQTICDIRPVRATYGRFTAAYDALQPYLNGTTAPPFTVSTQSLTFSESNGAVIAPSIITVQTSSPSLVPLTVMAAAVPWLRIDAFPMINADSPGRIGIEVVQPPHLNGTYTSSLTITVGTGAPVTIPVTLNVTNTQSRVIATLANSLTPFIVPVSTDSGLAWPFGVTLTETNGVGTKITALKVAGQDISSQIPSLFGSDIIQPSESVTATVEVRNIPPWEAASIEIDGVDPGSGATWSQTFPGTFMGTGGPWGGPIIGFGIPEMIYRNTAAPECPFRQHVVFQGLGQLPVSLNRLYGLEYGSPQIASLLGSSYIPVGGSVQGDVCWPDKNYPITVWTGGDWQFIGTDSSGKQVDGYVGVSFSYPPPALSRLTVNTSSLSFNSTSPVPVAVSVDPGSSAASWIATVVYAQSPASWLGVTPKVGMGPAALEVSVDKADLTPGGIYYANLIIQSLNSTPQYQNIPVTLQIPTAGISGVSSVNGASFAAGVAPGMVLTIFDPGISLATGTQAAGVIPLPTAMQSTIVTVNNIPAPLYYVSPKQLNVQIPYEVPLGPATLTISNGGSQRVSQQIYVNAVAPGIFLASDQRHIAPNVPAKPGGYATLFLTGQGPVSPAVATGAAPPGPKQVSVSSLPKPFARVNVYVNGVQAQTSFVGIPYYLVGVTQVNFIVPPATPAGTQPLVVVVGDTPSNTAYIDVGP